MTGKEAQRELAGIGAELEIAIQQLTTAPAAVDCWPVTLQSASIALARIRAEFPAPQERPLLRPLVERIQQSIARVNLLVESAALFYCGCVAVTTSEGTGYNHEGTLEQFALGGRMQLEA